MWLPGPTSFEEGFWFIHVFRLFVAGPLMEMIVQYKAAIVVAWAALFFMAERLAPATRNRSRAPGLRLAVNGAMIAIVALASPLIVLPIAHWASAQPLWTRPPAFVGWGGLAMDILLLDLFAYWLHRAYHERPLLWRLHEPHHLDEHLDATSAFRFHLGEVVLSALLRAPLVVALAIPFVHVVIFETLLVAGAVFHHSNVKLPTRLESVLSGLVVTPSIHWVHHHAQRDDTDSNYGAIFSFWDRAFATKNPSPRTPDMKIGVEGVEEKSFFALMLAPFTTRRRRRPA